jgi:exosortase
MDYSKILILLIIGAFYLPIFQALFDTWMIDPYYSHGFIVPLISGYIIWKKRKHLVQSDKDFTVGAALLAAGLAVYGYGIINKSLFVSALSFLIVLSGYILSFYGRKNLQRLLFPIAFLLFMIPTPYQDYASTYLQSVTASSSASMLRVFGIPVVNNGSQLSLGTETIFVIGDPCSGLRTMLALFALAAVFAYIIEGSAWKRWVIFLFALPIALAANILRVVLILSIAYYYGEELAMTVFHDFSSIFLFLVAFIFLIVISRWLGCKEVRNMSQ